MSQVVPYVERLARRGLDVTLHSFEKQPPSDALRRRLVSAGVSWQPHAFRGAGTPGGIARVAHGAALVAGAELVHARSDLPATSTMLARRSRWVWDVRGFWREDRIAMEMLRPGSAPERVLRRIEAASARSSSAIVTLSRSAADVLAQRFGPEVGAKVNVITTCVDLERFVASPLPSVDSVRFLLAGSLSSLYDIPTMLRLVQTMRTQRPVELTVLTPAPTPWDEDFRASGATIGQAPPAEMPDRVSAQHVGLSIRRFDVGVAGYSATPTKLGEFLACGRPVVVNAGLGDLDTLLVDHDCGVVMTSGSRDELERATAEIRRLLEDPGTPVRCRGVAEEHFNVERAVDRLLEIYRNSVA